VALADRFTAEAHRRGLTLSDALSTAVAAYLEAAPPAPAKEAAA